MTGPPNQTRKPSDATPYAALCSTDGTHQDRQSAQTPGTTSDLQTEAERLRALREALWGAFEAGPAAGLPNTLIDLTMAYTGSLRLQLNLKALTLRQSNPRPRPYAAQKPYASDKT